MVVRVKPCLDSSPPKKILAIRFQALGDTIITLPYLLSLHKQYPDIAIDFLTRKEVGAVPRAIKLFNKVYTIGGGRNARLQFGLSLLLLPQLLFQHYDAVIDLQNHKISRIICKILNTKSWSEFDRVSPISAGLRTQHTIEALWSWQIKPFTSFEFKIKSAANAILKNNGWKENHDLVVLNPAGFCSSRNWPIENYTAVAKLWILKFPMTQFVLLLLPSQQDKSNSIKSGLPHNCIDLTGKANQVEAFTILQKCKFMLTEDSGLMHMAWVQAIPTLALFSSSRKDWSAPQGSWSDCMDASDMECGPCQLEVCKFGDNRCLTRYTPGQVFQRAMLLMN